MTVELDYERFVSTMRAQAAIGGTENGGLHRLALSDADAAVRDWFVEALEELGADVRIDRIGNIFGRRPGTDPDAAPVLFGSHLDSQPYGGIYDGALGVVAALELLRTLEDEEVETTHPIEIVDWTNEEGSRFQPTTQGSGVWAGELDLEAEYAKTDADGRTLEEELERIGYKGDHPAEPIEPYDSFLELHIEQGPQLARSENDVGVVSGIVGLSWGSVTFRGEANHTGTTPMHHREDALVAASDLVTAVRRIPGTLGPDTVGTVGQITASPNSINVVPEEVTVTWGFRDPSDDVVDEARDRVIAEAEAAADREGVECEWEDRARLSSVSFPDRTVRAVETAAEACGYDAMELFSGAVHDAANVSKVCDSVLVFAASEGGKSHTEDEFTSWEDCYSAANTVANAVLSLAR